jgi:hypothetical protein
VEAGGLDRAVSAQACPHVRLLTKDDQSPVGIRAVECIIKCEENEDISVRIDCGLEFGERQG